ncbi:isochorismatase family protein [Pseudoalteromonas sp. SSDWG2]|uniref:isochorismatase family protein n=1 Tax=Pseudoalteromonas sp. SSDWG2 TaxID=3139391 RepID=UPI003BACE82F
MTARNETLVVIDMQSRLAAAMQEYECVLSHVQKLMSVANLLGINVIITEQNLHGLGCTDPRLDTTHATVLEKHTFSATGNAQLLENIGPADKGMVYVCGMESHVCVFHTVNALVSKGYNVTVLGDAVCSRNAQNKALALAQMRHNSVQVWPSESAIFFWLNSCEHPMFKEVLAFIK